MQIVAYGGLNNKIMGGGGGGGGGVVKGGGGSGQLKKTPGHATARDLCHSCHKMVNPALPPTCELQYRRLPEE